MSNGGYNPVGLDKAMEPFGHSLFRILLSSSVADCRATSSFGSACFSIDEDMDLSSSLRFEIKIEIQR